MILGDERLPLRFWQKVRQSNDARDVHGPCWEWTGSHTSKGYGSFYLGKRAGKQVTGVAHKMTYEAAHGRIRSTRKRGVRLVVDHRCRNRACVNPAHLELVEEPINVARGESPSAKHARKTTCPRGHAYTPANTYVLHVRRGGHDTKKRYCRACRRKGNRT